MKKALIIFFRYPEKGKGKTRLAAELGDDFVHGLYINFIRDIFENSARVSADIIAVYSSQKNIQDPDIFWNRGYQSFPQAGNDLGERVYNAMNTIFSSGYEKCVLIGSDSPDLPHGILEKSFSELDNNDYVLGPTDDGGYYLVGTNKDRLDSSIFSGIPWSTDRVLRETTAKLREKGYRCSLLDPWSDIDEAEDIKKYYNRNIQKGSTSFTMKYLTDNNRGFL